MKNFLWRFALIGGFTLAGLAAIWPPDKWPPETNLKLGIDLSGGTILVYEVDTANLPPGFKMDELVSALKKRADPDGVKEIPIRQIGGNRIEIILPKASDAEVEEVKNMLIDVGALEFRILANRKKDEDVMARALGPAGLTKPPSRYRWARLGEVLTGTNPTIQNGILTDLQQTWKKDQYAGKELTLTGKDSLGNDMSERIRVKRNTTNTLELDRSPGLKTVASYRIEDNPSGIHGGDPNRPDPTDVIVREEKVAPGRTEMWILYNLDRPGQEVTGKYLRQVRPDFDERLQPAVRFEFNLQGARRFSTLTRQHLPEEGDKFKYQLAILLDKVVQSAPVINSEIRDSGIIEGGRKASSPRTSST